MIGSNINKVLITGGRGFIGSHTNTQLKKEGYKTILFKGDITKKDDWDKNLKNGVDSIIHAAAIRTETDRDFGVNVGGTEVLAEILMHSDVLPSSLIYISSQAVYFGKTPPLKEEMDVNPTTPYSKSKLQAEKIVLKLGKKTNIRTVALRVSTVLGEGVRIGNKMSGPLALWSSSALNGEDIVVNQGGNQTRDYIHVADVAAAIVLAVKNTKMEGIFNVGGGRRIKLSEFAGWVKEAAKSTLKIVIMPGLPNSTDPKDLFSDTGKIQKFGWKPQKTAKEAVFEAVQAEIS